QLPPLAGQREVRASLLNALGQVVLRRTIALTAAGATADFATSGLAAGVYVLRVRIGDRMASRRLVKR
ncbi:MAG: T9SS type A sorting domain-containing protein, partial [Cytophagaceae bacterium]